MIYNFLFIILFPFIIIRILFKSIKEPNYLKNLFERFGIYKKKKIKNVIWIHAVSVGEILSARDLVYQLENKYPDKIILVTFSTAGAFEIARKVFCERILKCYLPYDLPLFINNLLNNFKPLVCILVETEIWPNLLNALNKNKIPCYIVNGRLSNRSFKNYLFFKPFLKKFHKRINCVMTQSKKDEKKFLNLGFKNVVCTGNMKYDSIVYDQLSCNKVFKTLRRLNDKIFIAASTRKGEEEIILNCVMSIKKISFLTIIAPRHPSRCNSITKTLIKKNIKFTLFSKIEYLANDTRVVLVDKLGELLNFYNICDLALVGGSILPFGGQNIIEPCALGKAVIVGEYTYNFEEIVKTAIRKKAVVKVFNINELSKNIENLISDKNLLNSLGKNGKEFVELYKGSTLRNLEYIKF